MRLETKFVQVPNNPATINATNNIAAVFGWTVQSIQITDTKNTHEGNSKGWANDYGLYMETQIITEHTNYASITYQRDIDSPQYEQLKYYEGKYNQCDSTSFLSDKEEANKQAIQTRYNVLHMIFKILFIAALIVSIWFFFPRIKQIGFTPLIAGIAASFLFSMLSNHYDMYDHSRRYRNLKALDNARRQQVKQNIVDQAKTI